MRRSFFLISSEKDIAFFYLNYPEPFQYTKYDSQENSFNNWISNIQDQYIKRDPDIPCKVFITSPRYTILPNALFSPNNSRQVFELNFDKVESWEQVYFNFISSFKATIIFGKPLVSENIKKEIKSNFSVSHLVPSLCDFALKYGKSGTPFLFVAPEHANLILWAEGKLISAVQFNYLAIEDIIYHLLANLKSHNILSLNELYILSFNKDIQEENFREFLTKIDFSAEVQITTKSNDLLFKL